jgi:hypothetical protein
MARHPDACVIYNPDLVTFWTQGRPDLDAQPLARYIFSNFRSIAVRDNYRLMVRNERDLASVDH